MIADGVDSRFDVRLKGNDRQNRAVFPSLGSREHLCSFEIPKGSVIFLRS